MPDDYIASDEGKHSASAQTRSNLASEMISPDNSAARVEAWVRFMSRGRVKWGTGYGQRQDMIAGFSQVLHADQTEGMEAAHSRHETAGGSVR